MATSLVSTGVQFPDNSIQARADGFPAGTRMLFQQTTAPTGWTKVTTGIDNRALRVVTGNVGAAGVNPFTGSFNSTVNTVSAGAHNHTVSVSVNNHTLSVPQLAAHNHTLPNAVPAPSPSNIAAPHFGSPFGYRVISPTGLSTLNRGGNVGHAHGASGSTAPHAGHAHGFNLNVLHIDVIVATRS